MSTGDHPLTACHVSCVLGIAEKPCAILDVREGVRGDLVQRLKWQVEKHISQECFGYNLNVLDAVA